MQLNDFELVAEANRLADHYPAQKIEAIKELRSFSNLGLKESKEIIDAAFAGTLVFRPNVIEPDEQIVLRSALEVLISANRCPVEVTIARRLIQKF